MINPRNLPNMGGTSNITSIEKLEGITNYINWKFAIKMLLTLEGLWKCVDGTDADAERDGKALARICLTLQPALYQHVRNCKKAKEAWNKLADCFEDKGLYRRVLLLRQLHRVEYNQFATMSDYIDNVMCLVQQLEDIGKSIDDAEVAEILLSRLPQEYDVIVSSLETACLTNTLSSEIVRMRLLQEDHRRSNDSTSAANIANNYKKRRSSVICSYCKRQGHTAKRCFKRKREQGDHREAEGHTMFASAFSVSTAASEFIVDSGASCTMKEDDYLESCVSCLTGKMSEASFPAASLRRATTPLELIHSDVAGPMQVRTWGGNRFLLTFTDDCTRKTFGYLMKSKSEKPFHRSPLRTQYEQEMKLCVSLALVLAVAGAQVRRAELPDNARMVGVDTVHDKKNDKKIDKDTIISQSLRLEKRKGKNSYRHKPAEEAEPDWTYSAFPADVATYVQEFKQNMSECLREVQAADTRPVQRLSPRRESPVHGDCLIACVLKRNQIIDNGKISKANLISLVSKFYAKDTRMLKKLDKNLDRCVELSAPVRDECALAARLNQCTNELMAGNKHPLTVNY